MLEFIAKYWLEFVFGLIALGMSGIAKYYYGLVKKGKQYDKDKDQQVQDDKMIQAINIVGKELKE